VRKPCIVCKSNLGHVDFEVREMYFGSREVFTYFECRGCGTLQIANIPNDLGRHYPSNYYSYSSVAKSTSPFEINLRRIRTDAWLGRGVGITGRLLACASKRRPEYLDWFDGMGLSTSSRILDVGCGGGQLLLKLRRDGFTNLGGIDPYLPASISHGPGLQITNHGIEAENAPQDLVMFHHSLEHMVDPFFALECARNLLSEDGHLLIRLPLSGGYAWRKYRHHWYAIDAPRHLFIPTPRAMHILADQLGLVIKRRFFDSDTGQFLASELYVNDIPLMAKDQHPASDPDRLAAIAAFVTTLNAIGDGDCGGFVLGRP